MFVDVNLISGVMVGVELEKDDSGSYLVLDLFILRILFSW